MVERDATESCLLAAADVAARWLVPEREPSAASGVAMPKRKPPKTPPRRPATRAGRRLRPSALPASRGPCPSLSHHRRPPHRTPGRWIDRRRLDLSPPSAAAANPPSGTWVFAHLLLHNAFGHARRGPEDPRAWRAACEATVAGFLEDLKVGKRPTAPPTSRSRAARPRRSTPASAPKAFRRESRNWVRRATAATTPRRRMPPAGTESNWPAAFSAGLREAVREGVDRGGRKGPPGRATNSRRAGQGVVSRLLSASRLPRRRLQDRRRPGGLPLARRRRSRRSARAIGRSTSTRRPDSPRRNCAS